MESHVSPGPQISAHRLSPRRRHCPGFTVLELAITLSVAGVLFAVAIPSLKQLTQNNRLTAVTNRLVSSIHLARSEAVTRNDSVIICSSDTSTDGKNWSGGWNVYAGKNCLSGNLGLLRKVRSDNSQLEVTGDFKEIIFRGDGTASNKFDFKLVNASFKRTVEVSKSGHVSTEKKADTNENNQ